jgi:hypothetical protein
MSTTFIVVSTVLNSGPVVIFVYEISGVFLSFKPVGTFNLDVIFASNIKIKKNLKKLKITDKNSN